MRGLIYFATAGAIEHGFECERFRVQMNAWGYRGCWTHRQEIMERIREVATEHGYRSDRLALAGHVAVAILNWATSATTTTATPF